MGARKPQRRGVIGRVLRDRSGAVLIYTALALPVLAGVAALSIDVSMWHTHKRVMQKTADAAAIAAALETMRSGDQSTILAVAEEVAALNGYDSARGDTITVNRPPLSGPNAGASDSVEVIIRRQAPVLLSTFVMEGEGTTIAARAVAAGDINDSCVWALNPTASGAVSVSGSAVANFDCGVVANSTDPQAITQSGTGSCLRATRIKTAGNYTGDCLEPTPTTGVRPARDPMRELQPPYYGACDVTKKTNVNDGQTVTLTPDFDGVLVVCADIAVQSGTLILEPGLYVFKGAGFSASAQATVQGADLHIYMASDSKSFDVSAGADIQLSAGTTGALAGVLIYQDRNAPVTITHSITGGSNMQLNGILYFPSTDVKFAGGASASMSQTMIIADTVAFTGNSHVGDLETSAIQANKMLVTAWLSE